MHLRFRISSMLKLKVGLQSYSNHDALLRTPLWQDYIFKFLSCETSFYNSCITLSEENENENEDKDGKVSI